MGGNNPDAWIKENHLFVQVVSHRLMLLKTYLLYDFTSSSIIKDKAFLEILFLRVQTSKKFHDN